MFDSLQYVMYAMCEKSTSIQRYNFSHLQTKRISFFLVILI